MHRACRWVIGAFLALYLAALALLAIGTFGWFGSPRGPLAGIFLVPLGLPWNLWLDGFADAARPWLAAAAPLINVLLALTICRVLTRQARTPTR